MLKRHLNKQLKKEGLSRITLLLKDKLNGDRRRARETTRTDRKTDGKTLKNETKRDLLQLLPVFLRKGKKKKKSELEAAAGLSGLLEA